MLLCKSWVHHCPTIICHATPWLGVKFLVVRRALVDLPGAGASISDGTTSCTSCMESVGAETFSGVS
jgi:hypothetical protein